MAIEKDLVSTIYMEGQFQSFESNPEIYGLNSEMELIGFQSKNLHHPNEYQSFFGKSCGATSSPSKTNNEESGFYDNQQDFGNKPDFSSSLMGIDQDHAISGWNHDERSLMVDDQSLRSCIFTNDQRPSQRLSLSLGSSYPSRICFDDQSFELRQQDESRFDLSSSKHIIQDGVLGKVSNFQIQNQFLIRSSKYLAPSQELLNEFCNLGSKQMDFKIHKTNQALELENSTSSLQSLDQMELQRRKTKLLQMLEEVDRRYSHYCTQMKAVVSSFEAIAGNGTAKIYSALASKAMSRHFRSLRDGIVDHIKATKKALGEKDIVSPGATRGETPRLRILDQTLRQQKSFQQMSLMETHPWRPQRGLPERAVSVLRAWLFEHFLQPYPSDVDKHILARQTGLSRSQVSNWFINARVRLWKPMVEEMYMQETLENENIGCNLEGSKSIDDNPKEKMEDDQKPTHEQLVRIDSECLSSIINNPEKNETIGNTLNQDHGFGRVSNSFGTGVELDFSTYNHNYVTGGGSGGGSPVGGVGRGGVSLTLGLQQHGGEGGSLGVSQNPIFHSRDHITDSSNVQYSLLESEGQNLQYRNLMEAELLHDLVG